ncbi:hypothetical protein FRB90_011178, partial [Tulasnella sp. 427]
MSVHAAETTVGNMPELRGMVLEYCNNKTLVAAASTNIGWNIEAERIIWKSLHDIWVLLRSLELSWGVQGHRMYLADGASLKRAQRRRSWVRKLKMGPFSLREIDIERIELLLQGAHSPCRRLLFPNLQSLKWAKYEPICSDIFFFLPPSVVRLQFRFHSITLEAIDGQEGSVMDHFIALDLPELK